MKEFDEIGAFFKAHGDEFLDPNAIGVTARKSGMLDHAYKAAYYLKRKLSGLLR